MGGLRDYSIPFKGLKEGKHEFEFNLNKKFFEEFEGSDIESGNVNIDIQLTKRTQFLEFQIQLGGTVQVQCDRCLESMEQEIKFEGKLYVKFGEEYEEQSDEIIIIPHEEYQVNLAQYFYDSVYISLPYQRTHPEDEDGNSLCSPEMLKKLEELSASEEPNDDHIDARWNGLKNLLGNNN